MVLPHKAFELNRIYILLLSYYIRNEHISVCVMIIDKQHQIFLTCKSVRVGKLSALAQKPVSPEYQDSSTLWSQRKTSH